MENHCNHFFILGEKKDHASCLGTHSSYCQFCKKKYSQHIVDLVCEFHEKKILTSKTSDKEEDQLFHVHVWDLICESPKTYQCVAAVTDWANSTGNYHVRVPCNTMSAGGAHLASLSASAPVPVD